MQMLRNGIFMLLTAALLIACSPSNSPEKVAQTYINAVLTNDIESIMATLDLPTDAPAEQDALVRGKLSIMLAETSTRAISFGGVKDVTYSKPEYNHDKTHATLIATIRYKQDDAPVKHENIALAKTVSGWKISL